MVLKLRKRLWLGVVVVVAVALAVAGPSIIAGMNSTALASGGCGMGNGSSSGGCGMMSGSNGTGACSHQGCATLSGTVTAIDKRDGSVVVRVKPPTGGDVARKALSQVKVGDALSMAIMVDKDGRPAAANTAATAQTAEYVCPMHPEVTSTKPGKCSKCGMDLERVPEPGK